MNKVFASLFAAVLSICFAQPTAQSQATESHPLPAGTTIPAMLDKWVDARKSKIGDEVIAQTTEPIKEDGQVIIPKGSKILGRVTLAKVRTNDDPSSVLGMDFDRVVLKKGGEIPLRLMIQAIAPEPSSSQLVPELAGASPADSTSGIGPINHSSTIGANADPNAGTPGRPASPANSAYEQSGGRTVNGALTPQCHGIIGIEGLVLGLEPKYSISLIASQTKNVRLDGRTQLMLRVIDK